MADIFISYAREDAEAAGQLATALEERGWSVFWDRRIPAGRRFADVIAQHIALARCVITLWSKAANESDWVLEESEEARQRNILTPARIEEVEPPWGFRRIHAADLIGWNGEKEHGGFQRLLEDIAASIGDSPPPASTNRPAAPAALSGLVQVPPGFREMDVAQAPASTITPHSKKAIAEAPAPPARHAAPKPGERMFEQLQRGIQAFQPDASWALYDGKSYEGWWFLTDPQGEALVRVKVLTNQIRVRIRARSVRHGTDKVTLGEVNYGGWRLEDESSVVRDDKGLARILKQIRAEWS